MMQPKFANGTDAVPVRPWYTHRWPWLLAIGPVAVVVAGIHTTWIAFTQQDALVVDDYYKQGKAINQDLRRDQVAASMQLKFHMRYDVDGGKLVGSLAGLALPADGKMMVKLIHPTQPEKDVSLPVQSDDKGAFTVDLPMLERARWQVQVESAQRDWRLHGDWLWPQQKNVDIIAG